MRRWAALHLASWTPAKNAPASPHAAPLAAKCGVIRGVIVNEWTTGRWRRPGRTPLGHPAARAAAWAGGGRRAAPK
eukprot:11224519-Lingulodinium_polyedra.AAC.1